jgi:hypothetical protein
VNHEHESLCICVYMLYSWIVIFFLCTYTHTHTLIASGPITCTGWSPPSRRAIIYREDPGDVYRGCGRRLRTSRSTATHSGSRTVAVAAVAVRLYYTDGHSITSRICSTAVVRTTREHFCYTRTYIFIYIYMISMRVKTIVCHRCCCSRLKRHCCCSVCHAFSVCPWCTLIVYYTNCDPITKAAEHRRHLFIIITVIRFDYNTKRNNNNTLQTADMIPIAT